MSRWSPAGGPAEPGDGILARVPHLRVWLDVAVVAATAASAVRFVDAHGDSDRLAVVLGGAVALVALYAADPRRRWVGLRDGWWAVGWCVALVLVWAALVVLAPSFSWVAVPLAFVALQVLPFRTAAVVVAAMTLVVAVQWTRMQHRFDPTVVVGPLTVAALTVIAYRALEREATTRRRLLEELREAQGELSEAQHTAGVLTERARLSREIHDSVAQSLSSVNLLLQAAEQDWAARPESARGHVGRAATSAREGLEEVRRLVRDLAPPELDGVDAAALPAALRRVCERATATSDLQLDVLVHGDPMAVPTEAAAVLLRTARGALANVVEHAGACRVAVSLTYQPDEVILDVRDDGRGFDPARVGRAGLRGRGLAGMAERARHHGGNLAVESAPAAGTAVAVSLPIPSAAGGPA